MALLMQVHWTTTISYYTFDCLDEVGWEIPIQFLKAMILFRWLGEQDSIPLKLI